MKARPILFSGPMVRALLDGRKTQTRRVVKGNAIDWLDAAGFNPAFVASSENEMCLYGKPGDLLWVRETWQKSGIGWGNDLPMGKLHYRATDNGEWKSYWGNWKPSIHMPRWVSQLTLEITSVRVERLQDISEEDAIAEGALQYSSSTEISRPFSPADIGCYRPGYRELWESINGAGSWDANPWVWVLEFTVHRCNVDELLKARSA